MTIKVISVTEAVEVLKSHRKNGNGRTFGVRVISRTDNTLKTMNCRFGVVSALKHGKAAYKAADKGLMTVYDQNAAGYRSINLSGLRSLTIDGEVYEVA
jgi:hypothetical protein